MSLVAKLRERQGEKTQKEFAQEMGLNQSSICRIYNGERKIGHKAAAKIARRYPELAFDVAAFLLGSNMTTEHESRTV